MAPSKQTRADRRRNEINARRTQERLAKQKEAEENRRDETFRTLLTGRPHLVSLWVSICIIVLAVGPLGILDPALPIAGDQVTHNWWLSEFRDRLFTTGSIFGWTNDLSLGYLFGFFYFPLPPLVFSLLSIVLSDAIAIKVMVVLSLVLLPVGALRLARGLGFSKPAIALTPALTLAAVFSNQPQFVGGTLYSTLTGEFSYAYGLAFALLAIGETLLVSKNQESFHDSGKNTTEDSDSAGKGSWWRAGLYLGCATLSHLLAAIPAALVFLTVLVRAQVRSSRPGSPPSPAHPLIFAALLAAAVSIWWLVPSVFTASEALGDGHKRVVDILGWMFPLTALPLVIVGLASLSYALFRGRPGARLLATLAASGPLALLLTPGSFMWNVRIMPWYYFSLAIAMIYLIEPVILALRGNKLFLRTLPLIVSALALVLPLSLPDNFNLARSIRDSQYGGASLSGTKYLNDLNDYLATLPPGRAMVALPKDWAGALPARDWVTALPMHTDGRITSAISLYYEASKSTPGIEYVHSHVSEMAHTSLSWFGYADLNDDSGGDLGRTFATGVRGMDVLGIKYYIVGDQKMYDLAVAHPRLRLIGAVGEDSKALSSDAAGLPAHQWGVFELKDSTLVESITTPVGVQAIPLSERDWASASAKWLATYDLDASAPYLVEEGPAEFDAQTTNAPVAVSKVSVSEEKISFTVSRIGVPILVKVSHSPRWVAKNAAGPYRAAPNLMVVVPTSQDVVLEFSNPVWTKVGPLASLAFLSVLAFLQFRHLRKRKS